MRLIRIRFTEDRAVEAQGKILREFKAGKVYDLPEPSARHWLDRCAELVEPEPQPEPEPAAEDAADDEDDAADAAPRRRGRPRKSA